MLRLALPARTRAFTTIRVLRKDGPIAETAKQFKADGKIGKKFTGEEGISKTVDENVGGPFSKDGAIGKQFTKDGAIGGLGQKAAEEAEQVDKDPLRK